MTTDTQQRLAVSALMAYLRQAVPRPSKTLSGLLRAVDAAFSDTPPRLVQVGDHEPEPTSFAASMAEYLPVPNPKMGEPSDV